MSAFQSTMREISEIATMINPMVRIDYARHLFATATACSIRGYDYDETVELGGFCLPSRERDYVLLSVADDNLVKNAKHELFHSIQDLLLPEELATLREYFYNEDELMFCEDCSESFSQWASSTHWRGPATLGLLFYRVFTGEVAARSLYHKNQVWTAEDSLIVDSATITGDHIILLKDGREKRIDCITLKKVLRSPLPPFRFRSPEESERVRGLRARGGEIAPIFGCVGR
ncbi:MAG: hypothetical protein WCJ64_02010 [Rhodospirillaceae bacterium]